MTEKGTYIFECDFSVTYVNIDKPEDRFTSVVESHAMDAGDKAPGKAMTYGTKTSMLKVFSVESGDNEESRSEQNDNEVITQEQGEALFSLIVDAETQMLNNKGMKISRALKFVHISELKASKFKEAMRMAKS